MKNFLQYFFQCPSRCARRRLLPLHRSQSQRPVQGPCFSYCGCKGIEFFGICKYFRIFFLKKFKNPLQMPSGAAFKQPELSSDRSNASISQRRRYSGGNRKTDGKGYTYIIYKAIFRNPRSPFGNIAYICIRKSLALKYLND